jgi:hypothetical protein
VVGGVTVRGLLSAVAWAYARRSCLLLPCDQCARGVGACGGPCPDLTKGILLNLLLPPVAVGQGGAVDTGLGCRGGGPTVVRRCSRGWRIRLCLPASCGRARAMRWWSVAHSLSPVSRLWMAGAGPWWHSWAVRASAASAVRQGAVNVGD